MTEWIMATLNVPSQPALSGPRFESAAPRVRASSSPPSPLILSLPLPSHALAFTVVIIVITIAIASVAIITIMTISAKRRQKQREGKRSESGWMRCLAELDWIGCLAEVGGMHWLAEFIRLDPRSSGNFYRPHAWPRPCWRAPCTVRGPVGTSTKGLVGKVSMRDQEKIGTPSHV